MNFNLTVLPGDGVGPEVTDETIKILQGIGKKYGHDFKLHYGNVGGAAIDAEGVAISKDTIKMCKKCDAVLLGAVGGPKWDDPLAKVRPEDGLLDLRKALGLFANLRPVKVFPVLENSTNLKPEVISGADFIFVRDVVGALRLAMNSDHHGVLNVGTGKSYSFNRVVEMLNERMENDLQPEYIENPIKNYVMHTLADTSKTKDVLGFEARYALKEGIDELVKAYSKR